MANPAFDNVHIFRKFLHLDGLVSLRPLLALKTLVQLIIDQF